MPNKSLKAESPLGGYRENFEGTELSEVTGMALVSIAVPRGGAGALQATIKEAYGCTWPQPGSTTLSRDGSMQFLGLQNDQVFATFGYDGDTPVSVLENALADSGYYTDQSDGWTLLRLNGSAAQTALERICPLDLHENAFPAGSVARTAMEHLNVIILREETDTFVLMGARSSAANLLHAIEQSVRNVA